MPRRGGTQLALLAITSVLWARTASSQVTPPGHEKDACFGSVDEGQHLRSARKLVAARDQFIQCARSVCPAPVRKDCAQWLSEVEVMLPTVVFGARDARNNDILDVNVSADGNRLADRLDGASVAVDPGPHVFRYEWEGHGAVEQQAVVREGEKSRLLTVSFPPSGARPIPVGFWVFSGLALAGAAGFVGLGLSGESDANHLRATCAPSCPASDVDSARTKVILANVSLGVAIASVGVAAGWLLLTRSSDGKTTALAVEPAGAGVKADLAVTF